MTIVAGGLAGAHALTAADNAAGALGVKVLRAQSGSTETGMVRALDLKGLPLGEAPFTFTSGDRETEAKIDLPVEIRNDVARLEIAGERSAGAVQLLDKRWRRRTVGVVSGSTADSSQPLLASTYYSARARSVRRCAARPRRVARRSRQPFPRSASADADPRRCRQCRGEAHDRLARWIEDGGVLVRFAGPRLAAPRRRSRAGEAAPRRPHPGRQPELGQAAAARGVFARRPVRRHERAERRHRQPPGAGRAGRRAFSDHTWATLADGTPLVTAAKRGKGLIVLFHVTADTRWSDLPLSGSFVDMLKRIVALAGTTAVAEPAAEQKAEDRRMRRCAPSRVLDGFGIFTSPPATARPVPADYAAARHPTIRPASTARRRTCSPSIRLAANDRPAPLDFSALGHATQEIYRKTEPQDLRGPILLAALALFLLDALIVLWLGGGLARLLPRFARAGTTAVLFVAALAFTLLHGGAADAQNKDAPRSALETKLAYVLTGDRDVDSISKSGLDGLTLFLAQRTALEAGEPIGLDIARDELAFFPLIYWPIVPGAPRPSDETLKRVDAYMKQGGTVLFDTRDAVLAPPGSGSETRGPGMIELRKILSSLDIPELEPVPRDHVLTKTFYLLRDFPGRFNSGQLWVEALPAANDEDESSRRPARGGDGVSSIIITSNDFAGAWAIQPDGQPSLPMVEGEPRQRELAFRAGVNIVMYTLTGNYKADQVHVPALLERLGQ